MAKEALYAREARENFPIIALTSSWTRICMPYQSFNPDVLWIQGFISRVIVCLVAVIFLSSVLVVCMA